MEPKWFHNGSMATSITIKGLPPELHRALKARATRHGRSLNKEIIQCLQMVVCPSRRADVEAELAEVREMHRRQRAEGIWVTPEEIERGIQAGRKRREALARRAFSGSKSPR